MDKIIENIEQKTNDQSDPKNSAQQSSDSDSQNKLSDSHILEVLPKGKYARFSRFFLLGLIIVLSLFLLPVVKLLIVPIILAATFSTLFYPMYRWLLNRFKQNRPIAAFVCCAILVLCLLAPTYIILHLAVRQLIDLYQVAGPILQDIASKGSESIWLQKIQANVVVNWLRSLPIDLESYLKDAPRLITSIGPGLLNRTSAGVFELLFNLFVMLFTMFYFFMDGDRMIKQVRYLLPFRPEYEDMIFSRFLLISRATIRGNLIVAIAQGSIGTLALLVFGVKAWFLLGFLMVLLAAIPMMGAWMILLPTAIAKLLIGHTWQGIGIAACSLIIVSNIDNLLRPRLVGQGAKMHDLTIFFSIIGGISIFGVLGVIVGPVVAALFVALVEIYAKEFKPQLTSDS